MDRIAVLYTNGVDSQDYHILMEDGTIHHNVFTHDRKADGHLYVMLNNFMLLYRIKVLWVHPDAQFSIWINSADFKLIPSGLEWHSPGTSTNKALEKPYCIRLGDDNIVMFPAYAQLKYSNKEHEQIWDISTPLSLLHTVQYVQRALDVTLKWTAAATALQLLKSINTHSTSATKIKPMQYDRWGMVRSHVVTRPIWSHRLRSGQAGLNEQQKEMLFCIGGDKNVQFLGACKNLLLPNGEPSEITNEQAIQQIFMDINIPSLWQYKITDVSSSMFNSYELYCPLSRRDNWASGELLRLCASEGIQFELIKGLAWKDTAGCRLDTWAEKLWFAISGLKNHHERFPDVQARANALGTVKKMYVEVIGRFSAEYSKEYYQRAWPTFIIHRAIRNQMASISSRAKKYGVMPALVVNDAFYVLTDTPDYKEGYPSMFEYQTEMRGYKPTGVCPLSGEIIDAFANKKPNQIEMLVKDEMEVFANATIR